MSSAEEVFVHVGSAFVFGKIPFAMCLVQHPPLFWREVECVRQALEHRVARF